MGVIVVMNKQREGGSVRGVGERWVDVGGWMW